MALKYSSSNAHGFPSAKLIISKSEVSATQKWLRKQCEELAERADNLLDEVAERAVDWAQEHYDEAYYAGEHDVLVRHEVNKRHQHLVIAEGDNLPFIEFGTGNGHEAWYFSTKDKDPTTRSGRLKGGVYAFRRVRTDDPDRSDRLNRIASLRKFVKAEREWMNAPRSEVIQRYHSPDGKTYTHDDVERMAEETGRSAYSITHQNWWFSIGPIREYPRVHAYPKEYKAQYEYEESKDAVRTYGNPPHHYMSRVFEEVTDQIDKEIGRL